MFHKSRSRPCRSLLFACALMVCFSIVHGFQTPIADTTWSWERHLHTAEEKTFFRKDCQPVGKCELCNFSEQKSIDACKETGRKQLMECTAMDGDERQLIEDLYSCKYTEADEEFAMIRFQMFCILIGSMAFASARRQKRVSASLFERRKQGAATQSKKSGRRSDAMSTPTEGEIELGRFDEEAVPLVESSSNPLAVI